MKRRLIAIALLLAGCAALFLLQREKAEAPITPRPLLYLLADTQQEAERVPLTLTRVSDQEENTVGEQLARENGLTSSQPKSPDFSKISAYLNTVGLRVAKNVRRKDIQYHFYLQNNSYFVNAFALPGGQVVVGRGLLEILESEDELAAILGHEIAHVDDRHAIERLQYQLASRKMGLDDLYSLGQPIVEIFKAGYTKDQELEADRDGLNLAVQAGYSPQGGVNAMKRLENLEVGSTGRADSPIEEFADVPFSVLQEYFRSHPPAQERRVVMENEIKEKGWSTTQALHPFELRPIFLTESGEKLNKSGKFRESIAKLKEAVAIDSGYIPAWTALADVSWRSGDALETIQAETKVVRQEPTGKDWKILARALAVSDETNAVKRLEDLEKESPANQNAAAAAAVKVEVTGLRFLRGDKRALADFQTIFSSIPEVRIQANARREMAWWMYRAGKLNDSEAQLQQARQILPQAAPTVLQLFWVLSDLGRQADAKEVLEGDTLNSGSSISEAEKDAARSVLDWRTEQRDVAKSQFTAAATNDPVWMVPRWVQNNYSAATAKVVLQLQASELERRAKVARERMEAARHR